MSKFLDHFDGNIMEYPRSIWRKMWGWRPFYWLRCHTFTKYHMIDCRNDYYDTTPYKWGWYDRCAILLLANFNILAELMEKEHPGKFIVWSADPHQAHAWSEMSELYHWWKVERKQEQQALSDILAADEDKDWDDWFEPIPREDGKEKYWAMRPISDARREMYDRYNVEETRLNQKDEDQLIRLIKIRMFLWT